MCDPDYVRHSRVRAYRCNEYIRSSVLKLDELQFGRVRISIADCNVKSKVFRNHDLRV